MKILPLVRSLFVILAVVATSILPSATAQAQGAQPISVSNADKVQQIALLQGNKAAVFGLAFSPDGKTLASGGIDKTIRVWDVKTAKQTAQLDGHTKQVILVRFSADGATLFSMGYDPALRLWDIKSGKQSAVQQPDPTATDISAVEPRLDNLYGAFAPDATLLASNDSSDVVLWNIKDKSARKLSSNDNLVSFGPFGPLAFSGDSKFLAAAYGKASDKDGNFVYVWKLEDVLKQAPLQDAGGLAADGIGPTNILTGAPESFYGNVLAFSPDATQVAVEDINNASIRILDVKSGKEVKLLASQFPKDDSGIMDNYIHGLAYSPDGSLLAVGSYDKTVRLWDVKAGKELKILAAHGQAATVTFSSDGSLLASSNVDDGSLELWGLK